MLPRQAAPELTVPTLSGTTWSLAAAFARPHFPDILAALDFVIAKDYPARGEA